MKKDYCITDKTDIFVFFEIIRQTGAESVLDAGMFLKRIGAVSRRVGDIEIDVTLTLDGLDMRGAPKLPVYGTIYNNIFEGESMLKGRRYDLAICMRTEDAFDAKRMTAVAGALLTDDYSYKMMMQRGTFGRGVQDVTVDSRVYKLVVM